MRVTLRFLHLAACFVFTFSLFSALPLSMDVFDVGQGNFIVLYTERNALVVDCGCTAVAGNPVRCYIGKYAITSLLGKYVRDIFQGKETSVIITHEHADHKNLLDFFGLSEKPQLNYGNHRENAAGFRNALGDGITVEILSSPPPPLFGDSDHDRNLVVKVKVVSAGGREARSILLTGDANGTLFSSLLTVDGNRDLLQDVDCLVFPHHGSNDSGECAWLQVKDFVSNTRLLPDLLTLISSNPDQGVSLPWPDFQYFSYKRSEFNQLLCFCQDHPIGVRSREMNQNRRWMSSTLFTPKPVFTTCSLGRKGFYRVVIEENYDMLLYEGFDRGDLWLYRSVSPRTEQRVKELLTVLSRRFLESLLPLLPAEVPVEQLDAR